MQQTRYIELIDEIKNHVFQWSTDNDWKKLPPSLNTALTTVMNELKIYDSLKLAGCSDDRIESTEKKEKISFIALFKQKYLEYTNFDYHEKITPATQAIVSIGLKRLKREGADYIDFINWFFDDFASQERNKQYMPPRLQFIVSTFILDKYLFLMKEDLKMKKKDIDEMSIRTLLLGIAVPFLEKTHDKDLSALVVDYNRGKIPAKTFSQKLLEFGKRYSDNTVIGKMNEILNES